MDKKRKFSHWIEAFQYARPYTLNVYVKADKTTCEVEDFRTGQVFPQCELPFAFNELKAEISNAVKLTGYELELFIADHSRRLAGLSNVGTKGQWEYAEPVVLKWFYRLSGRVTLLCDELTTKYEGLRVRIYTPFSALCQQWGYSCSELANVVIFKNRKGEIKCLIEKEVLNLGK